MKTKTPAPASSASATPSWATTASACAPWRGWRERWILPEEVALVDGGTWGMQPAARDRGERLGALHRRDQHRQRAGHDRRGGAGGAAPLLRAQAVAAPDGPRARCSPLRAARHAAARTVAFGAQPARHRDVGLSSAGRSRPGSMRWPTWWPSASPHWDTRSGAASRPPHVAAGDARVERCARDLPDGRGAGARRPAGATGDGWASRSATRPGSSRRTCRSAWRPCWHSPRSGRPARSSGAQPAMPCASSYLEVDDGRPDD